MKIITNGYGIATIYLDGKKSKYIVTTDGNIFNAKKRKFLKRKIDSNGYKYLLRYDTELKETIKSLMIDGYTNSEIIKITGIEISQKTNTLLYRMRKGI